MWEITARDSLHGSVLHSLEIENPSAADIIQLAEEAIRRRGEDGAARAVENLRSFVARAQVPDDDSSGPDGNGTVPMLEPIRRWASEAVEAAAVADVEVVSLREFAGGIGLIEGSELSSFAWHGDSLAVVPISEAMRSVELIYRPELEERRRRDTIKNTYWKAMRVPRWWPWPEVEVNLDVVGFLAGSEEGPALAEIRSRNANAPRRYSFQLDIASPAAGFLIVKPLFRLGRNLRVRARDPLREARVRRSERRLRSPSPDLHHHDGGGGGVQVVLVHGLGSTAAELARMLEPLGMNPARFEHDTFISIDDNAQELAGLLCDKLEGSERIIAICHSRGGLVARSAADLVPSSIARRLSIHTFGTPHLGTPLAELGRIVPLIHFLELVGHPGDVVRAAARYLLPGTWRIPEGIEEMSPDDAFIARMIQAPHNDVEALNSWGARYEDGCSGRWWHGHFARACEGTLDDPHDLVVPEPSSLGAGVPQGPLDNPSTHFDYLVLPQVHEYLRGLV